MTEIGERPSACYTGGTMPARLCEICGGAPATIAVVKNDGNTKSVCRYCSS